MSESHWQDTIAQAPETSPKQMSEEEFLARVRQELAWEAEAETEVASSANEMFNHLFGKNEALDALISESAKESAARGEAAFHAIIAQESK